MYTVPDRGPVVLLPHDPEWEARFRALSPLLQDALARWKPRVEHIGSTAVPDLPAKPVVDILVGVTPFEHPDAYASALAKVGFSHGAWAGDVDRHFFIDASFTSHIHIVPAGSATERNRLLFRDLLRADPTLRRSYADLKQQLAARFGSDRMAYAEAKSDFVRAALARGA